MTRVTWGKCKSFLCMELLLRYTLFETHYSLLFTTNSNKENIYCDESGNILNPEYIKYILD